MAIQAGQDAVAEDFINESERDATPSNDEGKGIKLEADGMIGNTFLRSKPLYILDTEKSNSGLFPEETLFSFTLPANTLTTSSLLRVKLYFSSFHRTTWGSSGDVSVYFKLGSSTILGVSSPDVNSSAAVIEFVLRLVGTNSQKGHVIRITSDGSFAPTMFSGTASEDEATDLTFAVTLDGNTGGFGGTYSISFATAELLY